MISSSINTNFSPLNLQISLSSQRLNEQDLSQHVNHLKEQLANKTRDLEMAKGTLLSLTFIPMI